MLIEALFVIAPKQKQPKCPSANEWVNKMLYVRPYDGTLLSNKSEQTTETLCNVDKPAKHYAK